MDTSAKGKPIAGSQSPRLDSTEKEGRSMCAGKAVPPKERTRPATSYTPMLVAPASRGGLLPQHPVVRIHEDLGAEHSRVVDHGGSR